MLLKQIIGKPIAHLAMNWVIPSRGSESDAKNWLARLILLPPKYQTLLYSACLYSNPYSNAGEKLRTLAVHSERRI